VAAARGDTPQAYNMGADKLDLRSAWWVTHSIQLMVDRDYENRIKRKHRYNILTEWIISAV